ncbi:hypothetical protein F3Y22_tig00109987pilonHSYRG00192 [Hibiscus syriacus]|uniref:Uncharacterized protein n=1 Tax=Hibiscus syriacus TaxID=106335 RepID=A0A6A3BQL0_HIBSY|nr:hypothetical protein F3Y22_tig00109987pilonHSYRG00192 [Hibiscus syriacus]
MMVNDEWVEAAITDDNVVVELLLRLKQAQAAPPLFKSALTAFKWGIRQRRSKHMLLRCDARRDGDLNVSARGSPTTPLCWSGGSSDASPCAVDGFEVTSTQVHCSNPVAPSRSKSSASSETNRTSSKRSRRKELDSNSSLIDNEPEKVPRLGPPPSSESNLLSDDHRKPRLDSHDAGKDIFVLPDLNMMPGEDDSGPETLHRTS